MTAARGPVGRRTLLAAVPAALAALALPAGCSAGSSGDRTFGSGSASIDVVAADRRRAAPALAGTTLTGRSLALSSWAGRPVVVNLWGSWCPPCRAEAAQVSAAARTLRARGVEFLGLDIRESGGTAAALAYYRTYDVPFPSLVDPDGSLQLAFTSVTAVSSPPATVVLDRRHRVAAIVNGPIGGAATLVDLVSDVTA